jgi:hypothetical protein
VQNVASASWVIPHNLGFVPAGIIIKDSSGSMVEGEVTANSSASTTINFAFAFSGTADLS